MPSVSKKAEQKRKALLCGPASGTRKVHDKNVLTIVVKLLSLRAQKLVPVWSLMHLG